MKASGKASIIISSLAVISAVSFVSYAHIVYTPIEPVKTYHEISVEEGLERLELISNDFKNSFEDENKPLDISFTYDMKICEDGETTSLAGYLIRKESTLENNYYLYGIGGGEFEEMWYLNKGFSTYAIERSKENELSSWEITKYEVVDWGSKEEAYEKVGNGSLGYVVLLVLSAGPGLSDLAGSLLENRVEDIPILEKFETNDDLGNLRYTFLVQDGDELQTASLEWNDYRITHFESSSDGDTVSYNFIWTDNIDKKPIPRNK